MFCPKCNSQLPDGSKFCGVCGEKLTDQAVEIQNGQKETDASASASIPKSDFVPFKKKFAGKKSIGIVVAVIAILIVLIGVKTLLFRSGSDNTYVYLSDGKYKLMTNLNKPQTIDIALSKSNGTEADLLAFSPDGKYIYYYTRYDSYSRTGSLCRAEYGKLKKDIRKNDKYIEIIAANVVLGFHFLDDGSVIYKNEGDILYYFNGKESIQIAKDVGSYITDGSERIVYVTGNYSEGYNLYGVVLGDIDNKMKLVSNFATIVDANDFNNILYTKNEDDASVTLYAAGFNKEAEKLGKKINILAVIDEKIYFTAENDVALNLYDFVEDDYADSDAGMTEPDVDDFSIPKYSYKMVYGADLSESDFDELYTTCTRDLYWYGESTWWCYTMKEAVNRSWGSNTAQIRAATQSFIDKFADTADENGYILVTDEVKTALKEIQKCDDNPEQEWQWMWLCYNKYQSGTSIDYDAYNAASDQWREASKRIEMRETLQNKKNNYAVRTLYCFDQGVLTAINETVLNTRVHTGTIVFNTTDLVSETIKMENVSSKYDVIKLFDIDNEAENYIVLSDGTSCQMSDRAAETFAEANENSNAALYPSDKEVFLREGSGTLSIAAIDGGVVGDFAIVTDDAKVLTVDGSILYYISGSYQNSGTTYCDLYSYRNETSTRLARDVVLKNIKLYNDGTILAYTGYRDYYGYELTMIDAKGETTFIGDNITQYIRVDSSTLLYISDGDLYLYNGKKKNMVQSDVDWIWSQNSMEVLHIFN